MRVRNHLPDLVTELGEIVGHTVQQKDIARATDIPEATLSRYLRGVVDSVKFEYESRLCLYFTEKLGRPITRNHIFSYEPDERERELA